MGLEKENNCPGEKEKVLELGQQPAISKSDGVIVVEDLIKYLSDEKNEHEQFDMGAD